MRGLSGPHSLCRAPDIDLQTVQTKSRFLPRRSLPRQVLFEASIVRGPLPLLVGASLGLRVLCSEEMRLPRILGPGFSERKIPVPRMGIDVPLKSRASPERADEIEMAAKRLTDLTGIGKQYYIWRFTSETVPWEGHGPRPFVKLDEPVALDSLPNGTYILRRAC